MITLAHLRSLLERAMTHTENPAIGRLTDRTVEGLMMAYLPRAVAIQGDAWTDGHYVYQRALLVTYSPLCALDLTDPGTAHALLVALALALGLDPGVGGVGVRWTHHDLGDEEWWCLPGPGIEYWAFTSTTMFTTARSIHAPTVAAEPDPIKALALAALHVLEHP